MAPGSKLGCKPAETGYNYVKNGGVMKTIQDINHDIEKLTGHRSHVDDDLIVTVVLVGIGFLVGLVAGIVIVI